MADNLTTTTTVSTIPDGTVISTDDAGASGHVQRIKLAYSADGVATHVTADADGLLVNLGANNDVTVSGVATAANQSTIIGHLDGVEGILTTIDADTGTLAGAVAGTEVQVDVVAALPAGTNAIGKLAANSGVDIGDVDVTSLPATVHSADYDSGAGTDTTLAFGIAVPASGGAAVIPGDATAGLKVDLGADNDVTVTGTVTANAGTNLNTSALALETGGNLATAVASLSVLDDWDETDRAKVNPIVGQAGIAAGAGAVGVTVPRVTLASDDPAVTALQILDNAISGSEMQVDVVAALPAGTNNIGDIDVLSIAAGDNNIGNVDVVTLPALAAGTNNIGDVDVLTLPAIPAGTNAIGKVGHDTTGFGDGRTTVTTAGTRVALTTTTTAKWVIITAETDNTGIVVVGTAAGVIAAIGTREGIPLAAGDSITLPCDDLAEIGLDATVDTEGVTYLYGT